MARTTNSKINAKWFFTRVAVPLLGTGGLAAIIVAFANARKDSKPETPSTPPPIVAPTPSSRSIDRTTNTGTIIQGDHVSLGPPTPSPAEVAAENERKRKEAEAIWEGQKAAAFVTLWKDDHFRNRSITFKFGQESENFHNVFGQDFDNEASSARWNVPPGWKVIVWGDNTFHGGKLELRGTGEFVDIEKQTNKGDEASSLQWVKE